MTVTANEKLPWGGNRSIYLWLNNFDISSYNIARVKYKAIGDYGINFTLDYNDTSLDWTADKTTYCPSYLNEMVIPLKSNQRRLNGIATAGTGIVPYEQFVIESVTFEKVDNPKLTDVYASNESPVIDKATNGKFDDKISAWDYVKNLGVGFQYYPFAVNEPVLDYGMDCFHPWGFKKPSKEIIHFIKEKGFKTLRLQTNSESHLIDDKYTIDPRYLKSIKEVVDWAIAEDMYVIICGSFSEWLKKETFQKKVKESVHYEGVTVSEDYKQKAEALIKALWKQYATAFNNSYDEHLIFENLNEPIDAFHEHNFHEKTDCAVCKKDFAILNEYNQLIVDTIRSTGGNNSKRFIMIEGLAAGWKNITTNLFKLPKDNAKDRLIPTAHLYPMGFSLSPEFGGKTYYTAAVKKQITDMFDSFDKFYFKDHVPVYISEVAGGPLGIPVMERINCMKDFMSEVAKDGRSCAITLHPADDYQNNSHDFDTWNIKWNEKPEYFDTVFYGAEGKEYPLSAEFLKNNETKVESIVGKNLLKEPFDTKKWGANYEINSDTFVRSVPESYKLEFVIKKTGSSPTISITWSDENYQWHKIPRTAKKLKGGSLSEGNVRPSKTTFTVEIDSETAKIIENSNGLYLMGQDAIILSMKVVE
ncbi:MAG: glycoside hydrolase family 5 protein [Spirochaetaceae bacterium]|nr:glycoside hydrolase family 5 protein [Spirochaetaceae bacterium]